MCWTLKHNRQKRTAVIRSHVPFKDLTFHLKSSAPQRTGCLKNWLSPIKVCFSCCESTFFHRSDAAADFRPVTEGGSIRFDMLIAACVMADSLKCLLFLFFPRPFLAPAWLTWDRSRGCRLFHSCCVSLKFFSLWTAARRSSACQPADWISWCETDMIESSARQLQTNNGRLLWANQTGSLVLTFTESGTETTTSPAGIQIYKALTF